MRSVVVAMIEAGGGHKSPAFAIAEELAQLARGPEADSDSELQVLDFHREVGALEFDEEHKRFWKKRLQTPTLTHFSSYFINLSGTIARNVVENWSKEAIEKGATWLLEKRPDIFLSTHYLNIPPALEAKKRAAAEGKQFETKIVLFATEVYRLSTLWIWKDIDALIVSSLMAVKHARELGMPKDKIFLFDYPVRQAFTRAPGSPTVPEPIPGSRLRVLLSAGAEGHGKVEKIVDEIIDRDPAIDLKVICGRNQELLQRLSTLDGTGKALKIEAYGFIDTMHEVLRKTDILISKAGPATTFEALHCGVPIVYFDAVSESERHNITVITKRKWGWFFTMPTEIGRWLVKAASNPATILEAKARILREPIRNGARDIAKFILNPEAFKAAKLPKLWWLGRRLQK